MGRRRRRTHPPSPRGTSVLAGLPHPPFLPELPLTIVLLGGPRARRSALCRSRRRRRRRRRRFVAVVVAILAGTSSSTARRTRARSTRTRRTRLRSRTCRRRATRAPARSPTRSRRRPPPRPSRRPSGRSLSTAPPRTTRTPTRRSSTPCAASAPRCGPRAPRSRCSPSRSSSAGRRAATEQPTTQAPRARKHVRFRRGRLVRCRPCRRRETHGRRSAAVRGRCRAVLVVHSVTARAMVGPLRRFVRPQVPTRLAAAHVTAELLLVR